MSYYLSIFGAERNEMLDWASHYIERGARITFFKGEEADNKGKMQPKPFWDALPKVGGKTVYWVNASIEYVSHMLDLGADGMKVNASDLARSQALENLGVSLIRQGVRLAPIGANKKAYWKCISPVVKTRQDGTTYETYNGALDAHWEAGPTTIDQLVWWVDMGAPALAALCGEASDGLYIFDIDVRRFLDKFLEQDGVLEILTRHKVPVMITGGGGYQLWFKVDGEVPGNTKYAWAPDPNAKEGRTVAIESRGPKRGYGLTPHSLHPKGTYYREIDLFGGSFDHIPTISVAELRVLEAAARATCEAPTPLKSDGQGQMDISLKYTPQANTRSTATKQPSERGQKLREARQEEVKSRADKAASYIDQTLTKARESGAYAGRRDVITVVNEILNVGRVLERYGYMQEANGRYSHPDAYSGSGVSIRNNRSIHHSTNDRLHHDNELDGTHAPIDVKRTRTPFDVICAYSFNGSRARAVKELAVKLGITYQGRRDDTPSDRSDLSRAAHQSDHKEVHREAVQQELRTQPVEPSPYDDEKRQKAGAPVPPLSPSSGREADFEAPLPCEALDFEVLEAPLPPCEPIYYDDYYGDYYDGRQMAHSPPPPPPPPNYYGDEVSDEVSSEASSASSARKVLKRQPTAFDRFSFQAVTEKYIDSDDYYVFDLAGKFIGVDTYLYINKSCDLSSKLFAQRLNPQHEVFVVESESRRVKDRSYQIVRIRGYDIYIPLHDDEMAIIDDDEKVLSALVKGDLEEEGPPTREQELNAYPLRPDWLNQGPTIRLIMKDGQHVGDVLDWPAMIKKAVEECSGKLLVQAPTASRKTTSVNMQLQAAGIPYDLFAPTQDLAKQIANDERYGHNLTLVMEDHNPDFRNHSSTYNGATKIRRHAFKKNVDLSKRVAITDEVHDFESASYKRQVIRDQNDVTDMHMAKVGMSATMPDYVYGFEGALRVIIERETPIKTPVYFMTFPDDLTALEFAKTVCEFPILHINDKSKLKALKDQGKEKLGISGALFTADTKEEETHQMMILKKQMPQSGWLGCTNLMNSGYSFFGQRSHAYFVSSQSGLSPRDIVQLSARDRNRQFCQGIFIYTTNEKAQKMLQDGYPDTFDKDKRMAEEFHCASILAESLNRVMDEWKPFKEWSRIERDVLNISKLIGGQHGIYINPETGHFEADKLAISQRVGIAWASACNANWDLMKKELAKYHVYAEEKEFIMPQVSKAETRRRQKNLAEMRKAYKLADRAEVIEHVKMIDSYVAAANIEINWQGQTQNNAQYTAATTLLEVFDAGVTFQNAKDMILARAEKIGPAAIRNLQLQIKLARQRVELPYHHRESQNPELRFYKDYLSRFTVGDELVDADLEAATREAIQSSGALLASRNYKTESKEIKKHAKSKQARSKLLKSAFKVEVRKGRDPENQKKRFNVFEIIGEFPERMELNYKNGCVVVDQDGIHDESGVLEKEFGVKPESEPTPESLMPPIPISPEPIPPMPTQAPLPISEPVTPVTPSSDQLEFWLAELERGVTEGWLEDDQRDWLKHLVEIGNTSVEELAETVRHLEEVYDFW